MIIQRRLEPAPFMSQIDGFVLAEVQLGTASFSELLQRLPSIYPTEVLASLNRLAKGGRVSVELCNFLHRDAERRPGRPPDGRCLLPLPHPLDYEWRFAPDSSRTLLNLASDFTPVGGDVLLFGTPGLAVEALALPINRRLTVLSEENIVTDRLITLNRATGSPLTIAYCSAGLPRESADAVILDPPWYMDFIRPMLAAAAGACRMRGFVFLSVPPANTRPTAEEDRLSIIRFAGRLGLDLVDHQPLAIRYDTPFFEANALAVAGIFPPSRWRRGDLLVMRKVSEGTRSVPRATNRRRPWVEVPVGRMRLFVSAASSGAGGSKGILPLLDGDVLPTVSRRHPRRRDAQIWTSGNRIYRTDNARLVVEAALVFTRESDEGSSAQPSLWGNVYASEALERVGRQIAELAKTEAAEERGSAEIGPERGDTWKSHSTNSLSKSPAIAFG